MLCRGGNYYKMKLPNMREKNTFSEHPALASLHGSASMHIELPVLQGIFSVILELGTVEIWIQLFPVLFCFLELLFWVFTKP